MEINQHGNFLEELLGLRRDNWDPSNPNYNYNYLQTGMEELISSGIWTSDDNYLLGHHDGHLSPPPTSLNFPTSFLDHQGFSSSSPLDQQEYLINNFYSSSSSSSCPLVGEGCLISSSVPQLTDSSYNNLDTQPFPVQDDTPMSMFQEEDHEPGVLLPSGGDQVEAIRPANDQMPVFSVGACKEVVKARGNKRMEGQPSKNLMAERRRRKRLNDRLSMLRSIVPKISKMDRTSILGDTIDYMKELLERINSLQQEIEVGSEHLDTLMGIFKESRANEIIVRNTPKFDVERRNEDTRVEICCQAKPGLLLSTVTALEALGLEIQHCVISCFSDFAMQASCSEGPDQRTIMCPEDIKQALFRSAGYGGKCLS